MKKNDTPKGQPQVGSDDLLAPVELVGGPMCGATVKWPGPSLEAHVEYYGGTATYKFRAKGKADYVRG